MVSSSSSMVDGALVVRVRNPVHRTNLAEMLSLREMLQYSDVMISKIIDIEQNQLVSLRIDRFIRQST